MKFRGKNLNMNMNWCKIAQKNTGCFNLKIGTVYIRSSYSNPYQSKLSDCTFYTCFGCNLEIWLHIINILHTNWSSLNFLLLKVWKLFVSVENYSSSLHSLPFCLPVDPSELLTPDPVELQCVPMETHFCPVPKLLMAAPVALNSVSLSRNAS